MPATDEDGVPREKTLMEKAAALSRDMQRFMKVSTSPPAGGKGLRKLLRRIILRASQARGVLRLWRQWRKRLVLRRCAGCRRSSRCGHADAWVHPAVSPLLRSEERAP